VGMRNGTIRRAAMTTTTKPAMPINHFLMGESPFHIFPQRATRGPGRRRTGAGNKPGYSASSWINHDLIAFAATSPETATTAAPCPNCRKARQCAASRRPVMSAVQIK
jgi:hypothetical protein